MHYKKPIVIGVIGIILLTCVLLFPAGNTINNITEANNNPNNNNTSDEDTIVKKDIVTNVVDQEKTSDTNSDSTETVEALKKPVPVSVNDTITR